MATESDKVTIVKTSEEYITAVYNNGKTKKRSVKKAKAQLEKWKKENEENKDKEDFKPHPTGTLETDLWFIDHFKVEEIPKTPGKKDFYAIGIMSEAFKAGV